MQFELTREYIDDLKNLIDQENKSQARAKIEDLHAADIADILDELNTEEAIYVFLLLDGDTGADVLAEIEEDDRKRFIKVLPIEVIAKKFIDHMSSDDAADLIGGLPDEKREEILSHIEDVEAAGHILDLLHYDENTAGGLMGKELVVVNENWTVLTCLRELSRQAEDIDEIYYVYVVDDDRKLIGTLSLKKMILSPTSAKIVNIYEPDVMSVHTDQSAEEVSLIMEKYDLVALPVIDSISRLVGRITIDDVVDVIRDEAEKDYQMASGISEDIEANDSILLQTRARLPWLLIGLVGGVLSAFVISIHGEGLKLTPALAFFIPLITAMGGNVGVQSSAIIVQGIASNSLGFESTFSRLMRELGGALINATTCSSILFLWNYFFEDSLALTMSVSAALFSVIIFAAITGTLIPLMLHKAKVDPALATGPFITTLNDIIGLFIYLSIGAYFYSIF
ncbi:magnesium transporter [Ancylomarina sp. 16SWW S1-10-2]|uniref:magnesium transporter n=1 Tax=Ancylomarina sp. 16SWW S1-10-2 TaxID=2499681 RepID=UPI0012AD45FE|nr:magnesium transporter [Ancylomarina sp. 16SWW S1-10-2]MRT91678.1 magnesium transporter [Ancylomarina sp. 16SWW S1-10-2]